MPSLLDFKNEQLHRLLAWVRYLYWADTHRQHFHAWMESDHDIADNRQGWEFIALMSAWYASLWVVVEGWTEIPLSDPSIDELLNAAPQYKELLRRYRNGVFHYQPSLTDARLIDFLKESDAAVYWVGLLHDEFCRFYWELIELIPSPPLRSELKDSIIGLIGWIPEHMPAAKIEDLRETARQIVNMLKQASDFSSPAALDLLQTVQHCEDTATDTEQRFKKSKAEILDLIKRKNDLKNTQ